MINRHSLGAIGAVMSIVAMVHGADGNAEKASSVHDFEMKMIAGETKTLSDFKGKTLLIVNVASRCGFTEQYAGLQALYEQYKDRGVVVLGFPSNDFLRQEPGSDAEILQFCSTTFAVTFPMFSKIHVKGRKISPLFAFLIEGGGNRELAGKVSWNFNKFLVGPDGKLLARFGSRTKPRDKVLVKAIEASLKPM